MYIVRSFFFIRIYFIRISRLKFSKFQEYFKNKPKARILFQTKNDGKIKIFRLGGKTTFL